ncbi:hypothetical protein RHGRI_007825 [Rhododendron griersonianum]|uniref:Uncharacterized protein n=1 Tax=Rhododendron griersonianum TaxID=479676 RepID=A0AAV6KZK8_9ERIC|nr:hypothetical protein RHGRI_007825 [Rhododendron griersonianum]
MTTSITPKPAPEFYIAAGLPVDSRATNQHRVNRSTWRSVLRSSGSLGGFRTKEGFAISFKGDFGTHYQTSQSGLSYKSTPRSLQIPAVLPKPGSWVQVQGPAFHSFGSATGSSDLLTSFRKHQARWVPFLHQLGSLPDLSTAGSAMAEERDGSRCIFQHQLVKQDPVGSSLR